LLENRPALHREIIHANPSWVITWVLMC
jgi:hypothetical protein